MINEIDIKEYKDANTPQPAASQNDAVEHPLHYKDAAAPQPALKFDSSKPRMDLLDPWALEGLAQVLTFGANKYAAHNWRNGLGYSRVIAAMSRHLSAIQKGEDVDPESGLPHVDHLGCCWMFLSNYMKTMPEQDNRWKKNENK